MIGGDKQWKGSVAVDARRHLHEKEVTVKRRLICI